MKKYGIALLAALVALTVAGCASAAAASVQSSSSAPAESKSVESLPVGPQSEDTLENWLDTASDLVESVQDSYDAMLEESGKSDAVSEGVAAAEKVREELSARIEELAGIDLSALTMEELQALAEEMSGMLTTIREARDQLAGI